MNLPYAYSPSIWPSAFIIILLIALFVYACRRRSVPGALPFLVACGFAAMWAVGSVIEHAAVDLEAKIFWIKFQSFWQPPLVASVTCFLLEYAWPGRWLTHCNLALFSIPPLLIDGMILTDNLHHLAWRSFTFNGLVQPQVGPVGWIAYAYAFGVLGTLNLLVFGWLFLHSPLQRWPVALMLVGQIGGRLLYLLERTGLLQSALPIDILGMAFEFLMYATALFSFQILNPIPLAHRTVIEQLQAGILVLDPQGKIVNLNPAASVILKSPVKRLLGNSIQDLLPSFADTAGNLQAEGINQGEIELGKGSETHYYQLEASSLDDWRGTQIGRLLVLRDVTEFKVAEAQLLEQQRALAMLQEREQLGRELHDNLGQVLGYASLKMSAARKLMEDGKLAKADEQLARIESSLTEAHADVREYILNLRTTPTMEKPFFSTLMHYLDGFHQNYGIQVDVSIGPDVSEEVMSPDMQMQLFRILQEALSNTRKHATTNHVSVSFGVEDGQVRMRVQDNGQGFDPLQAAGAGSEHFGLSIMRERAETLGGSLRVQSAPGEGTCVEVEVPANGQGETI